MLPRLACSSQTLGQVREGIRSQLLGEQRNAAMKRWLAQAARDLPVR